MRLLVCRQLLDLETLWSAVMFAEQPQQFDRSRHQRDAVRLAGLHAVAGNGPNGVVEVELLPPGTDRLAASAASQDDELQCLRRCAGQVAQPLDETERRYRPSPDGGREPSIYRPAARCRGRYAIGPDFFLPAATPWSRRRQEPLDLATQPTGSLGLGSPIGLRTARTSAVPTPATLF